MPEPEAYREGTVMVPGHDDLIPFVETLSYLMNSEIVRGTMLLESPLLSYRASQGGGVLDSPGGPSVAEMEKIGQEKNLPYWSAVLHFRGAQKVIDAQWEYTQEKFSESPSNFQRWIGISFSARTEIQGYGRDAPRRARRTESADIRSYPGH